MSKLKSFYQQVRGTLRIWFRMFVKWRMRHISHSNFVLILSVLVGVISGLAAVAMKNAVRLIQAFLLSDYVHTAQHLMYFILPAFGILITYIIIKYVIRNPVPEGVPLILYALSETRALIPRYHTFASLITAPFTVAFGGSVGLEAPTVITGAALGSHLGRIFHLDYKMRTHLLACAAAGTVASIFNAPIAGIVFAIEIIMIDLTSATLIPMIVASASASTTSRLFLGNDTIFHFPVTEAVTLSDIPFYIFLGITAGLFSVYFTIAFLYITKIGRKMTNPFYKMGLGGIALGLMLFLFPPLYGEGYGLINALIEGRYADIFSNTSLAGLQEQMPLMLLFLTGTVIFKALATSITIAAGGVGGIFAPTLFMGSTLGFIIGKSLNMLGFENISVINFTLVGMAALMGGIMRAPLTAIFLIAEITDGYGLFVPLMIVAAVSFLTSKYLFPHSVYTHRLAIKGELLTHHKDHNVLKLMRLEQLLERNMRCIKPEMTLGLLVQAIKSSSRNIFPVVDKDEMFLGIIFLDDVRDIMFDTSKYDSVLVADLMRPPLGRIELGDSMENVVNTFKDAKAWNLPVLKNGRYMGYLSRSKLFTAYRKLLVEFSED